MDVGDVFGLKEELSDELGSTAVGQRQIYGGCTTETKGRVYF